MGSAQGLLQGATQPLQELASGPTQALSSGTQSFTGLLQNFMGGFSGMGSPNAAALKPPRPSWPDHWAEPVAGRPAASAVARAPSAPDIPARG